MSRRLNNTNPPAQNGTTETRGRGGSTRWRTGQRSCDGRRHYETLRVDEKRSEERPAADRTQANSRYIYVLYNINICMWIINTHAAATRFDIFVPFPLHQSFFFNKGFGVRRLTHLHFSHLSSFFLFCFFDVSMQHKHRSAPSAADVDARFQFGSAVIAHT